MVGELATWQHVIGDERLLERAGAVDASDVSVVAALRREYPADRVAVALELCRARAKAVAKFGEAAAARLVADVQGVEQASGSAVAVYKAQRMSGVLGEGGAVVDACCGIGGDAMALAGAGLGVTAVDREPVRAWMVGLNAGGSAEVVCGEVEGLKIDGGAVHIDPARRDEGSGRRAWRVEDYAPGPEVIGRLIANSDAAAVKLSPGVDVESLPWAGEVEFISEGGRLVQAVLWAGGFAQSERRATLIDGDSVEVLSGEPTAAPIDEAQRYLYSYEAAVERAGLDGLLSSLVDAPSIHPRLGLLTSDRVVDSPWLTGFELVKRLPWRPKRVRQWLGANDGGLVEVKTRGKACDPDREQQRLRGDGGTTYTVFVLRFDTKVEALITRRL